MTTYEARLAVLGSMETRAQAPESPSFPRKPVIPAKAGIHSHLGSLDSRFRGNDLSARPLPVGAQVSGFPLSRE